MKVKLLQIGKTQQGYLVQGIEFYEQRIKNYLSFSVETIPALKQASSLSAEQLKVKEGEIILSKLKPDDRLVLLDEKGKSFTSVGFADFLQGQMNQGQKQLVFVIGGAYGFSEAVYKKAMYKISLSEMTFSHQLIRVLFMEQMYRAMTILNNHPYHHE
jgi:23S rRNA (pseudouridine1915-N3)-methyltransferase